jgi:sodium-coupled neutral amino acid transporter 9
MSNFLFHSVVFVHDKVASDENVTAPATIDNATYDDVQCVRPDANTTFVPHSMFDKIWRQNLTVPLLLTVFLFPLINCKSPTFFTKFNALGTVAVAYILAFVCIKSAKWGFHMNFTSTDPLAGGIPEFQWTFPALTGILSLAYFIHNAVISIMRNQRHPENNGRDLTIAYICVAFTYIFVGIFFYSSFPLEKTCVEDNLLNNFRSADVWAFVARIFLFFQMMTVFPLLMFIFRIQVLGSLFASVYPGLKHVLLFNSSIVVICVVMAIFLPKIGVIIRFSGALCGLVYVFTLPSVVYLVWRRRRGTLTIPVVIIHAFIIAIGVLNFIAQFLILEFK